jgi:3-hydroxyisobutyrate dehydrogenase/glyoxylate/succinic semialdehyde reductase
MLAYPEAVRETALGKDGFIRVLKPNRLWVDCSTVNPSFSREMAEQAKAHGVRFLDAPVTGSKGPAATATLVFWVGGAADDLEVCRPLLECMGSRIVHCGGPGAGTSLKMVINQFLGTGMAAFAEAFVLGEALGLSRQKLFEALLGSPAVAPFIALKRDRMEQGNYEPADFPLRWLQKDLHLVATSAHEAGVAMPLTNAAKEIYRLAIRNGYGDADFSAVYDYLARSREDTPAGIGPRGNAALRST